MVRIKIRHFSDVHIKNKVMYCLFNEKTTSYPQKEKIMQIITSQISALTLQTMKHNFAALPLKQAVKELENLPATEIRGYLDQTGLASMPRKLREVAEASLEMRGGDEHSSIFEVLKPAEINNIIEVSPEIFSSEFFDVVQPGDYLDASKIVKITTEDYTAIKKAGDPRVTRRLVNLNPLGATSGPWGLLEQDLVICPDIVWSYFSAIVNAGRDQLWKEAAIRAIGEKLLVYTISYYPVILETCLRDFPEIATQLSAMRLHGVTKDDAVEAHLITMQRLQQELQGAEIPIAEEDLTELMAELRNLGVQNPSAKAVVALQETKMLEEELKKIF
jgi:hypothetical protein